MNPSTPADRERARLRAADAIATHEAVRIGRSNWPPPPPLVGTRAEQKRARRARGLKD